MILPRVVRAASRPPPTSALVESLILVSLVYDFNLSAGRYRPMSQSAVEHRDPRELLDELAAIEAEIVEEVEALRAALASE